MFVYDRMTQEALDRQYSPSSCAPGFENVLDQYAEASAWGRDQLAHTADMAYGPDPSEKLDFFPVPDLANPPVHVFVHGGHWQQMSRKESCFAAPAFVRQGIAFIALGYGLAPRRDLPAMVASVRRALRWIRTHAAILGVDPDRISASGSSAGAHLVAMALCGASDIAAAILLSGVYDLEPVRLSYVNDKLGMDQDVAATCSPLLQLPLATSRVVLACGRDETLEYVRQHRVFARAIAPEWDLVVEGRHHFDLPFDLGKPETELGRASVTAALTSTHSGTPVPCRT